MPVVSYGLPALIAIGQVIHHHRPTWNPIARGLRSVAKAKSLRILERIQPSSGGYLEATPLTSFVIMSLVAMKAESPAARRVVERGVEFLVASVRADGSWPIDTNLSIWLTTLSINALAAGDDLDVLDRRDELAAWLVEQQTKEVHPYTGAAAGAWGWSHLPGSVPDCDDTPGATLALVNLERNRRGNPIQWEWNWGMARNWIIDLQNRDGGWPTFCRGWGKLAFDRSGTDLTAHSLRAFWALGDNRQDYFGRLYGQATERGFRYLSRTQRSDGSWLPLWFGNQHSPDDINPVYGTSRVLAAYRDLGRSAEAEAMRGIAYLLGVQNPDGGWGGAKGCPTSVEETAVALEILIDMAPTESAAAVDRGMEYLVSCVEDGTFVEPTPIGFYFAKLWYFERLYPVIFTVAALGRAMRRIPPENS
jgi:squalene-hopene/tetraprenyl-beta-curcumene cyclase